MARWTVGDAEVVCECGEGGTGQLRAKESMPCQSLTHALRVDEGIAGVRDGGRQARGVPSDVVGQRRNEKGQLRCIRSVGGSQPRVEKGVPCDSESESVIGQSETRACNSPTVILFVGSATSSLLMKSMAVLLA